MRFFLGIVGVLCASFAAGFWMLTGVMAFAHTYWEGRPAADLWSQIGPSAEIAVALTLPAVACCYAAYRLRRDAAR